MYFKGDLYGHFDGTSVCPPNYIITKAEGVTTQLTEAYRQWIQIDKSPLSLLVTTFSDEAIEYVISCKSAREAWLSFTDRYASVLRARVNQLKAELHTIHKGGDTDAAWLLAAWDVAPSGHYSQFATVLWLLWNVYNSILIDLEVTPAAQIVFCSKDCHAEFQKILLLHPRQSSVSVSEKQWQIPHADFCKLNVDGALNMSLGIVVFVWWCVIQWAVYVTRLHCVLPVCSMS